MYLKAIYIHPIKALKGVSLSQATVEERGLRFDRRWMLTDKAGRFLSQREFHQLALFKIKLEQDFLEVSYPGESVKIQVPLAEQNYKSQVNVQIWDDSVLSYKADEEINHWFGSILKTDCSLVYMGNDSIRIADQRYTIQNNEVSFADGFPYLMISEASLSLLNKKLDAPIPMDRFRPNFVIGDATPHAEDTFAKIKIGSLTFRGVKPCARCMVPTIDQKTGLAGKEPIKTLSTYRKFGNKILFGENFCWDNTSPGIEPIIQVGDEVTVLQEKLNKSIQDH